VAEAAQVLNLSERQLYRSLAAARDEGLPGLVHGNRGRVPWNKSDKALRARVLRLVRQRYTEVNDCHLQGLLEHEHSIRVHPEALPRRPATATDIIAVALTVIFAVAQHTIFIPAHL
jgi:hypothetical protein